jgi:hypothetical protein
VRLEHPHNLTVEAAREKLVVATEKLLQLQPPAGVKILQLQHVWEEGKLLFSFKAKKGLFSCNVRGVVMVDEEKVVVEVVLPGVMGLIVGEEKLREGIEKALGGVLAEEAGEGS